MKPGWLDDRDHEPVLASDVQRRVFTANGRDVRRFALAKVMRNIDLAAELDARIYVCWGGRDGAESGAAKDARAALDRLKEAFDVLTSYVIDHGYTLRFAIRAEAERATR
jgi:xylose isomerase